MTATVLLFLLGLTLSALFSGAETGFYRATRVRLLLDGLGGDLVARVLLWLTNNPALFVATMLVGNNLANYLTSLAIVLGAQRLLGTDAYAAELLAPLVLTPIVFVYGELLPKNLFYHAPNLLLRRVGPLLLIFAVAFAPISAVLWALGRLLQAAIGQAPLRVRLALARKELYQVLQEGQEAGILRPSQRQLAQNLVTVASRPAGEYCTPVGRVPAVRRGQKTSEVIRLARRQATPLLPVSEPQGRKLIGYVRVIDLCLSQSPTVETIRPLVEIHAQQSHIAALHRLQSAGEQLARVVNDQGQTIGLLSLQNLTGPLFRVA